MHAAPSPAPVIVPAAPPRAVEGLPSALILCACLLADGLIALADYFTGAEIAFLLFYLAPIAVATWRTSRTAGYAVALVSVATSVVVDLLLGRYRADPAFLLWNFTVQCVVFLTAAHLVDRLRRGYAAEHSLAMRLDAAYRELDGEMRIVGEIQRSLLPAAPPSLPGWQIAVHYAPSARAGGDYYDFLLLPDGRVGLLVADASGHGASAAVVMAMTRLLVHLEPATGADPEAVLVAANRRLAGNMLPGHFVTACYAILDPASGRLSYSLAGHPPPLVVRAAGSVVSAEGVSGFPLGIDAEVHLHHAALTLAPGDAAILFTDGVPDARAASGALLGDEEMVRALARATEPGAAGLVSALAGAVAAHVGSAPPSDDVTILAVRRVQDARV